MVFRLGSRLRTLDSSGRGGCRTAEPLDAGGWVFSSDKAAIAQRSAVVLCGARGVDATPWARRAATAHRVAESLEQQG